MIYEIAAYILLFHFREESKRLTLGAHAHASSRLQLGISMENEMKQKIQILLDATGIEILD
jgi:hypothetical protein